MIKKKMEKNRLKLNHHSRIRYHKTFPELHERVYLSPLFPDFLLSFSPSSAGFTERNPRKCEETNRNTLLRKALETFSRAYCRLSTVSPLYVTATQGPSKQIFVKKAGPLPGVTIDFIALRVETKTLHLSLTISKRARTLWK